MQILQFHYKVKKQPLGYIQLNKKGIYFSHKTKEAKKMLKCEKDCIKARANELIREGVDKELARVMAKVEFDCGIIKPVVYYD